MDLGITTLVGGLGVSFEAWVCIGVGLGILVFFAKSVQLGLMTEFIAFSAITFWFWNTTQTAATDLNYIIPLILMLIFLVLMALSLFFTHKQETRGGFV